ncbi:hypothetical protein [Lentzea nigeriaca]|uniref:hypothetical protein n=1 Tax=Lentzea nigeriaca TaxID=1128665 RepID=UPI001957DE2B|nr:hypothetical protein [Lentzea nigeriaca]MBM7863770.1 hypothetical protein [Lentzea nigeriaca]
MTLILLHPTSLPRREEQLSLAVDAPAPLRLARRLAAGVSGTDLLDRLRALPARSGSVALPERVKSGVPYTYDHRLREFDEHFGVERVDVDTDGVFARSLLVAYRSLLEEGLASGTRMSWARWSALVSMLQTMIVRCAGETADLPVAVRPPLLRWHLDPERRWRVGHHVFFVVTQCLIVALQSFVTALREDDLAGARRGLRLATRLLDASSAAFVFTAEFGANQYHHTVRPTMEPPFVSAGFSGLLSPDHHYLVRLFAEVRPTLRALPADLVADHAAFVRALGAVYESHKYVCARFGGDTGASLRTGALPAVEVLHALKLARTKIVGRP